MLGRFITLEGIEGVGKTTHLPFVAGLLKSYAPDLVLTRDPGGTAFAERVRKLLLTHDDPPMPAMSELLLLFAARAAHVEHLIRPALARGSWVLSDRFTDATYAYQGGGRELPVERIAVLERMVAGDLRPDLTILLDAPAEIGLRRARRRSKADRFEDEQLAFFHRVREVYRARARAEPARFIVVDASGAPARVQDAISAALEQRLAAYG
jgi:dTMP kinase